MANRFLQSVVPAALRTFLLNRAVSGRCGVRLHRSVRVNRATAIEAPAAVGHRTSLAGSRLGRGSYVGADCAIRLTQIGRYCSIGDRVRSCLGIHPTREFVSTHPAFYSTRRQAGFTFVAEDLFEEHRYADPERRFVVQIGNDVWIGSDVTILDGVRIGDGAVVGACAVVTHDLAPYSINVGVPARPIGARFEPRYAQFLERFRWWDRSDEWLRENAELFASIERFMAKHGGASQ